MLLRTAYRATSTMERRPSFSIILALYVSTVLMLIPNTAAISLLDFPSAKNRITWRSLQLSWFFAT